jgi:hypothetical protein
MPDGPSGGTFGPSIRIRLEINKGVSGGCGAQVNNCASCTVPRLADDALEQASVHAAEFELSGIVGGVSAAKLKAHTYALRRSPIVDEDASVKIGGHGHGVGTLLCPTLRRKQKNNGKETRQRSFVHAKPRHTLSRQVAQWLSEG